MSREKHLQECLCPNGNLPQLGSNVRYQHVNYVKSNLHWKLKGNNIKIKPQKSYNVVSNRKFINKIK